MRIKDPKKEWETAVWRTACFWERVRRPGIEPPWPDEAEDLRLQKEVGRAIREDQVRDALEAIAAWEGWWRTFLLRELRGRK